MSKPTSAPSKRVQKKSDEVPAAPAVAVAAPAVAEKKSVKKAVAAPAAAAPAPSPSVTAAPVASEVAEVAKAEVKSIEDEIKDLVELHQKLREQATNAVKTLQRLQKRVAKEVKEAGRRRRRASKEAVDGTKEKRPTIFTTPVTLRDPLCKFLGLSNGSQMTPADVTRAFSAYVEKNKLKDAEKGHTIHPDVAMRNVLGVKEGEQVTYRNIQSYLYKLYVLPEKKSKAVSA
jgi:chromatin remodeling complex protein RSC6